MPDIISPGGIIHTMLNSSVQGYLDTLSEEGNSILLKGRSLSRSRNSYFTGKNMSTTELAFNTVSSQFVPQDDYYGTSDLFTDYTDMWGWQRIGMEDAWDITKGNGVIVAVLDTGIDFTHSELENNIWRNDLEYYGLPGVDDDGNGFIDDIKGWDFVGADYNNPVESNNPIDNYGHGTHVAGIIAADENDEGIIGVAPEAKIMPLKVLDDMGSGSLEIVARAIRYAADNFAKVINMSLVAPGPVPVVLREAMNYAYSLGCVLVSAAGNYASDVSGYAPANNWKTLTVSAIEGDGSFASSFSNYGDEIDVAAPGVDILSLRAEGTDMYTGTFGYTPGDRFVPGDASGAEYYVSKGTSMAAPYVAGLAALLYADDPTLSNDAVMNKIRLSAEDLGTEGFDEYFGYGLIDAYSALTTSFDSTFDILEYYTCEVSDRWTFLDTPGSTSSEDEITGIKNIDGVDTKILYQTGSDSSGADYLTIDPEGYKYYGLLIDLDEDGVDDDITYDSPITVLPRYVDQGATYNAETTFMYTVVLPFWPWSMDVNFRVSSSTIVHGLEDVTLDSGVIFKNALKVTMTLVLEDTDELGLYESKTVTYWIVKNLGDVKTISSTDESNIRTAETHYQSGSLKSKLLESADPEFLYYEFIDEDFDDQGYGRNKKAQRADGSFELYSYWPGSATISVKEIYNADGDLLETDTFYVSGTRASKELTSEDDDGVIRYDYDQEGRCVRKTYSTGERVDTEYWQETGNMKKWDKSYNASLLWQKTIQYREGDGTMHHQWIRDIDPGSAGDDVYYQYDVQERQVRKDLDTGDRIYTEYWNESDPEKKQDMFFNSSLAWQKTIEYYNSGTVMHHEWLRDANTGASGDAVYCRYDSSERIDRTDYDTGERIYTEYWQETGSAKKKDMFFDPSLAWQKAIEYYSNGTTMHHQWIKDADPGTSGNDVYYRYDSQGRMDRKDLDTGGRIYTEYWNESDPEKKQDMFFDPSLAWQKTIEYYSNGTTMHYQWFKDENPEQDGDTVFEEYNTSGDCILRRYDTGDTWTPGDAQAQAVELNDDALAMNDIQAQKVGIFNGTGMAEPSADPFTG